MRNIDQWKPSKFVRTKGRLRASRDPKAVGVASRVVADLTARFYEAMLPKYASGRLIDLGCGYVPLYDAYKGYVSSVTGVDWASSAHPSPHLDHEQDLNSALALPDASFDTVLLSDVLEHIRKPQVLMNEMHRILGSGGRVILNVPFIKGIHEQPHDYHRFTRFALLSMAEEAGFEVTCLEPLGGMPEVLGDLFARMLRDLPFGGYILAKWVQAYTGWFAGSGWGKKLSQRTAEEHPLGYGVVLTKR